MFANVEGKLSIVSEEGQQLPVIDLMTDGHPAYVYDLDGILNRVRVLRSRFQRHWSVHYAVKANFHPRLLAAFAREGLGADVVSAGELKAALEAGIPGERIVFSGVGKTAEEIRFALRSEVKQINVESLPELERIAAIAEELSVRAPVAFRMNPDVKADTHPYIHTGFRENKFGLDFSEIESLLEIVRRHQGRLELRGLTLHIGSQIRDVAPFAEAIEKTLRLHDNLVAQGFALRTFDVGGGLGIDYLSDDLSADEKLLGDYVAAVERAVGHRDVELLCEPGRFLVARFGLLAGEVQYVKTTPHKYFVILNTGMHHLMRPALYEAHHRILPLVERSGEKRVYDVVGPICESADVLGHDRLLAEPQPGDYLAILDAGAYGAVMASHYNLHAPPREIVVSQGRVL